MIAIPYFAGVWRTWDCPQMQPLIQLGLGHKQLALLVTMPAPISLWNGTLQKIWRFFPSLSCCWHQTGWALLGFFKSLPAVTLGFAITIKELLV